LFTPIVSDCVQNARIALEYLVFELVGLSATTQKQTSKRKNPRNYFPLAKTDPGWRDLLGKGYLDGVNVEHVALIHDFQPYQNTTLGTVPARILHELRERSNPDKHNLLTPTQLFAAYDHHIGPMGMNMAMPLAREDDLGGFFLQAPVGQNEAAAAFADPGTFVRSKTDFFMKFESPVLYKVGISKPLTPNESVNEILWCMCEAVDWIVSQFESEFS
jgi:hypothetical protein